MGVIDFTTCRRCARLRGRLCSRDYTCADCDQRRLDEMSRRFDRAVDACGALVATLGLVGAVLLGVVAALMGAK